MRHVYNVHCFVIIVMEMFREFVEVVRRVMLVMQVIDVGGMIREKVSR